MSEIHIVQDCKVYRGTGLVFFPEMGSFLQCSACVDKIIGDLVGEVKRLNKVAEDNEQEIEHLQKEIDRVGL